MIREGKINDIPSIVRMAQEFWKHTKYPDAPFCPNMVAGMAEHCIDNNMMAVVEIDGKVCGFCCGIKGPLLASPNYFIGTEIAWWVDEEHRSGRNAIGLLKKMEKLAKEAGCIQWNMVFMYSSMPDFVEGMYEKMGYEPYEKSYGKRLI